jgi:hypothetical protein
MTPAGPNSLARGGAALFSFVALALAGGLAAAQRSEHARAVLEYRVASSAPGCPTRDELADAVAARLGYDPFGDGPGRGADASQRVSVEVTFAKGTYTGKLLLGGTRSLTSTNCRELVDSLAVAVALGLDPESALRPPATAPTAAPTTPPTTPPAPSVAPPAPTASTPAAPPASTGAPSAPLAVRVWLGPLGAVGDTPSPTLGLGLGGELRVLAHLAFEAEASSTLPSSVSIGRGGRGTGYGSVSQLLVGACVPFEPLSLCATGSGGFFYADAGDVDVARAELTSYGAVGLRASFRLALSSRLFLRAQLDGQVPLARTELRIDGASLWETSPVVGRLGLALGLRL